MEIRTVEGRPATTRAGAAEYLARSLKTINEVARRRTETGWPEPVEKAKRADGKWVEWYALADLDRFRESYIAARQTANRARVHQADMDGDPEELITAKQFRDLIQVSHGTWSRWVDESMPAWLQGRDGYLPRPDAQEPARRGVIRMWTRRRAVEWINNRRGKVPSPGRPPRRQGG